MVKYIGTRAEWQRGGKQRAKARLLGVFQIRPNVVFQWLRMLKAVNPLWADIVITDETEAVYHKMTNVLETLLADADILDSEIVAGIDERACGGDTANVRPDVAEARCGVDRYRRGRNAVCHGCTFSRGCRRKAPGR